MKIDWNRKYNTIAVYAALTVLAIMLMCVLFFNFSGVASFISDMNAILSPFYIGLIVAYIANPIMKFSEKYILRFKVTSTRKFHLKRALSITISLLVLAVVMTILILLIIPQVLLSLTDLAMKLRDYIERTVAWLAEFLPEDIFTKADMSIDNLYNNLREYFANSSFADELSNIAKQLGNISANLETIISSSVAVIKDYVPVLFGYLATLTNGMLNIVLGIFFAIYTLASKEKLIAQVKKVLRAFTSEKLYNGILELGNFTNKTFGSYLIGKVIDSLIVGIVMFIACAIFKVPYAILVSTLVAIFNVIPIIGPFIGAIPGVLIIFIVDPSKVLPFIIINVIVQQIDGNIIIPKVLGETTGLSSLWVLFSITVMGGIWGMGGMFIGVPIFAILYMLFKLFVEHRLKNKDAATETIDYYSDREAREFTDHEDNTESFAAKIKRSAQNASFSLPFKKASGEKKPKAKKKKKSDNGESDDAEK